jgi:hypothetical protein
MQVRVVSESCLQRDVRRREQRAMSPAPCAVASLPPRAAAEVLRRKTALGRGRGAHSAIANGADAALLSCAAAVPGAPASATHPLKLLAYYWHPIRHARGSSRRGSTPRVFRRRLAWLAFKRATLRRCGRPGISAVMDITSHATESQANSQLEWSEAMARVQAEFFYKRPAMKHRHGLSSMFPGKRPGPA